MCVCLRALARSWLKILTAPRFILLHAAAVENESDLVARLPHRQRDNLVAQQSPSPPCSEAVIREHGPTTCAAATVVREVVVADYLPTPPSAVSSSISSYLRLHITPPQPCQHPIFTRIAPQPQAKSPAVRRQRPSTASIQPPLVPQAAAPISLRKLWHPHTAAAQ